MGDNQDDDFPITPEQFHEMASQLRYRKIVALFGSAALIILLIGAWFVAQHVLSSNARQDCKTQYNSILQGPVTARDNLSAQISSTDGSLNSQLGAALLEAQTGQSITAAQVVQYAQTKTTLDHERSQLAMAIISVKKEPSLNTASTKGFVWHGHHYSACPGA